MHDLTHRFLLTTALILGAGAAQAVDRPLPLTAGTYVVANQQPCDEAPLAAVMSFDGSSFGGPHESACQTRVVERHGTRYRVRTTCKALGDGTPTAPSSVMRDVRIDTRTTFFITRGGQDTEYALCPGFH